MHFSIYLSGGPGVVVEIDESKFGKHKYHRGKHVEGQCVFGGYQRSNGRVYMVAVWKIDLVKHFYRLSNIGFYLARPLFLKVSIPEPRSNSIISAFSW